MERGACEDQRLGKVDPKVNSINKDRGLRAMNFSVIIMSEM